MTDVLVIVGAGFLGLLLAPLLFRFANWRTRRERERGPSWFTRYMDWASGEGRRKAEEAARDAEREAQWASRLPKHDTD